MQLATGIGSESTQGRVERLLETLGPVEALLSTGFAGALSPDLRGGDVVLAERIVSGDGSVLIDGCAESELAESLLSALRAAGGTCRLGGILAADTVLGTPAEKESAHERSGALAVDLESKAVVAAARSLGVRHVVARAIIDEASLALPLDTARVVDDDGFLRPLALGFEVARHPTSIRGLIALRSRLVQAERAVESIVDSFLRCCSPTS